LAPGAETPDMHTAFEGETPTVADSAYVADQTALMGDVTVGERASIFPFVSIRGDVDPAAIGARTNVQEFATVHCGDIGDEVTVGHGAVVDDCTVEDHSLIGMGSCVMGGATVESNCVVAANAVVQHGQTIPEGHLAYGVPAETRELSPEQRAVIEESWETYVDLGREHAAAQEE